MFHLVPVMLLYRCYRCIYLLIGDYRYVYSFEYSYRLLLPSLARHNDAMLTLECNIRINLITHSQLRTSSSCIGFSVSVPTSKLVRKAANRRHPSSNNTSYRIVSRWVITQVTNVRYSQKITFIQTLMHFHSVQLSQSCFLPPYPMQAPWATLKTSPYVKSPYTHFMTLATNTSTFATWKIESDVAVKTDVNWRQLTSLTKVKFQTTLQLQLFSL